MTKEKLTELACDYIARCENASLELSDMCGKIEEAETIPAAVMMLGSIKDQLSQLCHDIDPDSEHKWFRKEHK